jgi:ribosomal protein L44E
MNGSSKNFIDTYNYTVGMYQECQKIINLIDDFSNLFKRFSTPGQVVPDYKSSNITVEYKDMYKIRKALNKSVNEYLDNYVNDLNAKYKDAYNILIQMKFQFNIVVNYKEMKSLTEPNPLWVVNNVIVSYATYFPSQNYDIMLAVTLKDPLMSEIKKLSNADSDEKKSGEATKLANIVTTNTQASQLYTASQSRIVDPVTQRYTTKLRAEDIHKASEAFVKTKKIEHVEQKDVLSKLANGQYLSDLVNNLESKTPGFLKSSYNAPNNITALLSDKTAKYALRNLVGHSIVTVSDTKDPQGKELKSIMRERTRKKFGENSRFCDENKDKVNGKWVLTDEAKSLMQLENSRKALRNKILKSIQ